VRKRRCSMGIPVSFNGLFHGWVFGKQTTDKQNRLKDVYKLDRFRRNYHVLLIGDKWCVHGEGAHDSQAFQYREDAIAFARGLAQSERTEAIVHTADGAIERAWVYQRNTYPQESLAPVDQYPMEGDLGEFVI
ncbi:MAG TPA: DUF2188 domain-containing protein, partial [Chroococcales cyanobacterium]